MISEFNVDYFLITQTLQAPTLKNDKNTQTPFEYVWTFCAVGAQRANNGLSLLGKALLSSNEETWLHNESEKYIYVRIHSLTWFYHKT